MSRYKRAFTLVELLVVIAIIGLLATLSVIALNSARAKARDTKRVADIRQISTALEMFYNDAGRYPKDGEWASGSLSYNGQTYLTTIPTAPSPADGSCDDTNNPFTYAQTEAGASYTLSFCLGSNTGNLAPGIIQNNPGGMISLGLPNNGGGVTCLNSNTGFETILSTLDSWNMTGMNPSDQSDYPAAAPIQSTDAYDGSYAVEFRGDGTNISMMNNGSIVFGNGESHTTRLYVKGSGSLFILYMTKSGKFWNFTLNQWDSGINPFGPDYMYTITPSASYSEFVVPNVVGNGEKTNALLASLNNNIFIDSVMLRKDDTGSNLFTDPSFESWTTFPDYWYSYKSQSDDTVEVEDDPAYIYAGSHSMKVGYGSSFNGSVELSTSLTGVTDNFDLNFFARSDDGSSVKGAEVWIRNSDYSMYYDPNSNSWQSSWSSAGTFSITNSFAKYTLENIPPPPGGTLVITLLPGYSANSYSWFDNVCISTH